MINDITRSESAIVEGFEGGFWRKSETGGGDEVRRIGWVGGGGEVGG